MNEDYIVLKKEYTNSKCQNTDEVQKLLLKTEKLSMIQEELKVQNNSETILKE
jgi:hypothetical protein